MKFTSDRKSNWSFAPTKFACTEIFCPHIFHRLSPFNLNRHTPKTCKKAFLGSFRTPEYCLLSHFRALKMTHRALEDQIWILNPSHFSWIQIWILNPTLKNIVNPEFKKSVALPVWNLNLESPVRLGAWIPNPWPPSSRALLMHSSRVPKDPKNAY